MIHFTPEEFWCKCGREACEAPRTVHTTLLDRLEVVRGEYGRPLSITSGLRCAYHNAQVGGVSSSGHLTGYEADVACVQSGDRYALLNAAFRVFPRIGIGKSFLHLGCDPALPQRVVWHYYPPLHE